MCCFLLYIDLRSVSRIHRTVEGKKMKHLYGAGNVYIIVYTQPCECPIYGVD